MLDSQFIIVSDERFRASEALFQPSIFSLESYNIHENVYNPITKCNSHIRKECYGNFALSVGNARYPGIVDCMQKEITILALTSAKFKVATPTNHKHSVWIGSAILTSLSTF